MLVKGSKIKLINKMGVLTNIGEVFTVFDVDNDNNIYFKFNNGLHLACVSANEFEEYFEEVEQNSETFVCGDWVRLINNTEEFSPMRLGSEYIIRDIRHEVVALYSEDDDQIIPVSMNILRHNFEKFYPKYYDGDEYDEDEDYDEYYEDEEEECEEHEECEDDNTEHWISEDVDDIMDNLNIVVTSVFDKCVIVACELPNGFVITESYTFVSPDEYDQDLGVNVCLSRIEEKLYDMEKYGLLYSLNIE